jgi:hypothetical protein
MASKMPCPLLAAGWFHVGKDGWIVTMYVLKDVRIHKKL